MTVLRARPLKILDRYLIANFVGPSLFGLSAFTLIFVATQIIAVGKLVSDEHAPLVAAIEYFLWEMPQYILYVIPMAMLFGVLLSLQRLSGESEVTAMKAGGISLGRIVAPLLVVGLLASLVSIVLQEALVPFANGRAAYVREAVIKHLSALGDNLTFTSRLPGGGRQLTAVDTIDPGTQNLLGVTVVQYDARGRPQQIIFSDRAVYQEPEYSFTNAKVYHFAPDGSSTESTDPQLIVDIGEPPNDIAHNAVLTNPEEMSRAQIRGVLASGQLSPGQVRTFDATYQAKLARPFAAFVFTLVAVPFGLRPSRGGGTSLGFGLAVAIVFVYYVISTVALSIGGLSLGLALPLAWAPNLLFTAFGLLLLKRASGV